MIRDFIRDHLTRWRRERWFREWDRSIADPSSVRVLPPLYDHETRGDFR